MKPRLIFALLALGAVSAIGVMIAMVAPTSDPGTARPGDTSGENIVAHATWNRPRDVSDMVRRAHAVVRARPVEVVAGPTFKHAPTPGVPPGGRQEIPTQNVIMELTRQLRGRVPARFVVNRPGGRTSGGGSFEIAGDPVYEVGTEYVLFLYQVAGSEAWYTLAPDGRLEIPDSNGDALVPVVEDGAARAAADKGLARLEKEVTG